MPTLVTDPNVLAQLEGGGGNAPGRPVTDPKLLAQLEGGGGDQRPFLEKLGSFARNVYENPPPTIAGARDIIKGAPAAAQELTWGADPAAAEQAAGTMAGAAGLGLGFKGPGGTNVGVAGRPIARPGTVPMPTLPPLFPREAAGPSVSQQAVEAAGRGGYTLPSYVTTEGTVIPQVASSLKNVPWGGQPIVRSHDELLAAMGRSAGEIAPAAGTPETAGERARTGLASFIKTGSQKPVGEAYTAVDALIDPTVRVPLENTREAIGQLMAERTQARIPGQSKAIQTVFDAVQDPRGMDYAGTKGLRSFLGEKTPQELAVSGISPVENKRIYAALTKDLGNVVREAGGPPAFSAWQEANALARLTSLQRQALSKVIGTAGDAAPETVFNRLVTYANSKAGADLQRLQLAKRAMGPGAWSEVGSALIDRLGKAPDGTFSPQRFVTAFGNMAPAARNEVFSPQQHAALMDLFTVSKHIQDRITRFGNPSGTARGGILGQAITGGALWSEPISTIISLVGARLGAEALSRPAVVRAATQAARTSLSGNPVTRAHALAVLRAVATREGLISGANQQNIPGRQAGGPVDEGQPYRVGEQGPEVFVPDRPGTIVPGSPQRPFRPGEREQYYVDAINGPQGYPDFHWVNPAGVDAMLAHSPESKNVEDWRDYMGGFGAAASKVRRRYPTREPDPASLAASQGKAATWEQFLPSEQRARQSAASLQAGGDYNPRDVFLSALGVVGAPAVGPAQAGSVLGAGAVRRGVPAAITPEMEAYQALKPGSQTWREAPYPGAPYPQYATEYPPVGPPKIKLKDKPTFPGETYEAKLQTPEAKAFMKTRAGISKSMESEGYPSYFDPEKRFDVNPANYPLNIDTTQIVPKKPEVLLKHLENVGAETTRQALQDAYAKGVELGGQGPRLTTQDWYMMGQLEADLVRQMGAKAGREAFKQKFATSMGATTGGMDPRSNLLAAGYQNFLASRGQPWPVANQWPVPVGARYGEQLGNTAQRITEQGGFQALGEANPKRHNFAGNFMGHRTPGTMDEQMTQLMQPGKTQPDWYGVNERIAAEEAAKADVDPRKFQETGWHGFKNQQGIPMIVEVNAAIERMHRLTGMPRQEIVRRAWGVGDIPVYGAAGMLGAGGLMDLRGE